MHSQLLPAAIAPPPAGDEDDSGDGLVIAEKREEDYPEKINLDLGIGSCGCANEGGLKRNKRIKQEKKESLFTALQFHEFHSQILIYNSIASGLPVPFHLFLPVWTSVFNSLGPAIYKKYPSCKVSLELGSKNVIETQRQRCRRTDGKKWQCRRDAIPHQKYCEAHMHRGAKRFMLNPQFASDPLATSARMAGVSCNIGSSLDNGINLNTIPASPQHVNNSTSSTSDATTITDENISFCLNQSLHNC